MKYRFKRELLEKEKDNLNQYDLGITDKYYYNGEEKEQRFYFDKYYDGRENSNETITIFNEYEWSSTWDKKFFYNEKDEHNEKFQDKIDKLLENK